MRGVLFIPAYFAVYSFERGITNYFFVVTAAASASSLAAIASKVAFSASSIVAIAKKVAVAAWFSYQIRLPKPLYKNRPNYVYTRIEGYIDKGV